MTWQLCGTFLVILAINLSWNANATSKLIPNDFLVKIPESRKSSSRHLEEQIGTKWAVLVAGSKGFANYRHQADVCHAYQVLKKGGLKDENIIVFMYDDIAYHPQNPRPGVIINKPDGDNVYNGVPKDYTGNYTTAENFYAVLLGNKSALTGGSGKVLNSGPNDQVFIFYSDHGAPGFVTMPVGPLVFGRDLVNVLQKKHQANGYQKMVFYLEACEAGSMFDGLLQDNINIYVNTASNPTEPSYAVYCPGDNPGPPASYDTCLGDLFSVSWTEDCDKNNLSNETLAQQYEKVKLRTGNSSNSDEISHVTQYGNLKQSHDLLSNYMMSTTSSNLSNIYRDVLAINTEHSPSIFSRAPNQRDADLLYLWTKVKKATINSNKESYDDAKQKLYEEFSSRKRTDYNINKIGKILFANANSEEILSPRPAGQPLVDDWDCFKSHLEIYERYCGALSSYGMKYTRLFGNTCNAGVTMEQMIAAAHQTCS